MQQRDQSLNSRCVKQTQSSNAWPKRFSLLFWDEKRKNCWLRRRLSPMAGIRTVVSTTDFTMNEGLFWYRIEMILGMVSYHHSTPAQVATLSHYDQRRIIICTCTTEKHSNLFQRHFELNLFFLLIKRPSQWLSTVTSRHSHWLRVILILLLNIINFCWLNPRNRAIWDTKFGFY